LFDKCVMVFGDPIKVETNATEQEVECARLRLENEMNRLEREAESEAGHPAEPA
jgi:hypothetical protein